jgi:glycosyltransferase involved in cell wall biosynthesis
MRICLNLLAATAGGQITRARAFLDRFARIAPDSKLIVLKEKSVLRELGSGPGCEVMDLPIGLGPLKALLRTGWENLRLKKFLRAREADLYLTFSHYLPRNFPQWVPSVVGVSNLAPFSSLAWEAEKPLGRIRLALLRRSIVSSARRASTVIALSQACSDLLTEHGVDPKRIVVIPNGVDVDWRSLSSDGERVCRDYGITRPYLLYVSHFYRYKNHLDLVKAFAALEPRLRASHQLVLVGRPYDRNYFGEVLALRDRLGLRDDVLVIPGEGGKRLKRLYQQAALFVFTSLIENSPSSLLEAMAAGVPVITSRLAPMPEFAGAAAEYFDVHDVRGMAARISALLADPARLDDMRALSIARASRYSWDNFVARVVETCRETLDMRQARLEEISR